MLIFGYQIHQYPNNNKKNIPSIYAIDFYLSTIKILQTTTHTFWVKNKEGADIRHRKIVSAYTIFPVV